jgi:hypothetical protein
MVLQAQVHQREEGERDAPEDVRRVGRQFPGKIKRNQNVDLASSRRFMLTSDHDGVLWGGYHGVVDDVHARNCLRFLSSASRRALRWIPIELQIPVPRQIRSIDDATTEEALVRLAFAISAAQSIFYGARRGR